MQKIQKCLDSLIDSIMEGETYKRYQRCEKKLEEQPELKKKIYNFRLAAFRLNNEAGEENLFEQVETFARQYRDFRKDPLVNEYLEAELDMCRLVQKVQARLYQAVNVQMP